MLQIETANRIRQVQLFLVDIERKGKREVRKGGILINLPARSTLMLIFRMMGLFLGELAGFRRVICRETSRKFQKHILG